MLGHTAAPAASKYRTDIDGLRALAVLPVVAFHAGIKVVPGGFVGVDIFFVISGYLITQVLAAEIRSGRFSVLGFYERRIRRIVPALVAMMLATLAFGLVYSLPGPLVDLGKSSIAAILSVSNVYFWLNSSYFDSQAHLKPLLHTWSLAVEEQFYIFWPLYLLVAHRYFSRHLLSITAAIGLISLSVSAYGAFVYPDATFYLVHTRFWELALGGGIALMPLASLGAGTRNVLSLAGLVLIVASIFLIHSDMPFPGLLALPPCLGTALVILGGRDGDSAGGRLLSWRPIVFVGLISYSLYLWHWPISVFQRNYAFLDSGASERTVKLLIVAVSLVMATLSWKFVEQPFRTGKFRPSKRRLVQMAAASAGVVVAISAAGWAGNGYPSRFTPHELEIASYLGFDGVAIFRDGTCFLSTRQQGSNFAPECLQFDSSKKNYLVLGDSHAAQLWPGLKAVYTDINFLQATAPNCFPTVRHGLGESPFCNAIVDRVLKEFLVAHPVDRVILAARWKESLNANLADTLDWLNQHKIPVTLVGPTVVYDLPLPQILINASQTHEPDLADKHWDVSLRKFDRVLAALATAHSADYISMIDLTCSGDHCIDSDANGIPLVTDGEHFSVDGSKAVAERMKAASLLH